MKPLKGSVAVKEIYQDPGLLIETKNNPMAEVVSVHDDDCLAIGDKVILDRYSEKIEYNGLQIVNIYDILGVIE